VAEGESNSSMMNYSLSQLDSIGDVDAVAEADVYLAYGRDLQAEEILKEAMRATPERQAIRLKLLEVYAKRRDTKGLELLATQVYSMTKGEGEDWAKAQEIGRSVDAENPLYQPGGQPSAVMMQDGEMIEPLGASTMPASVKPASSMASQNDEGAKKTLDLGLDLDLDLDTPDPITKDSGLSPVETTQPLGTGAQVPDDSLSFELPDEPAPAPASSNGPPKAPISDFGTLDFDLGAIDEPRKELSDVPMSGERLPDFEASVPPDDAPTSDFGAVHGDPLERKLELAEEFRQIGDIEGARDLLEEVIAKADGTLKTKAQGMLDGLA
jgi:pilus assembly protein FimV